MARGSYQIVVPLLTALLVTSCATVPLDSARRNFNLGRLDAAVQDLDNLPNDADRVLNLMERGMIRHVRRDYTNSTRDWLEAVRLEKELETHSVSKAGASMIVNDSLLNFRGYPYERTYLHVFLAKNYLAQGLWEDAAVEARNIALRQSRLEGFPDDAYSHYLAGFCFELCGDDSNAAMQYRHAAKLMPCLGLDGQTGRFITPFPGASTNTTTAPSATNTIAVQPFTGSELICFIDLDGGGGIMPEQVEMRADGKYLGTGRILVDIAKLNDESSQRMALRKATKTISRIALKSTLAIAASSKNKDLSNLLWLWVFASETEDTRRWETLPARLAVVRAPCPDNPESVEIILHSYSGTPLKRLLVPQPIRRKDRLYVAFCRDHP